MTEKLLPCPFCGAPASMEEYPAIPAKDEKGQTIERVSFSVGCNSSTEESCMGYQSLTMFNTREEAAKAWNKRTFDPTPWRDTIRDDDKSSRRE